MRDVRVDQIDNGGPHNSDGIVTIVYMAKHESAFEKDRELICKRVGIVRAGSCRQHTEVVAVLPFVYHRGPMDRIAPIGELGRNIDEHAPAKVVVVEPCVQHIEEREQLGSRLFPC